MEPTKLSTATWSLDLTTNMTFPLTAPANSSRHLPFSVAREEIERSCQRTSFNGGHLGFDIWFFKWLLYLKTKREARWCLLRILRKNFSPWARKFWEFRVLLGLMLPAPWTLRLFASAALPLESDTWCQNMSFFSNTLCLIQALTNSISCFLFVIWQLVFPWGRFMRTGSWEFSTFYVYQG